MASIRWERNKKVAVSVDMIGSLQTWLKHQVTVDRRITPPTAASERSMIVSCHAAPQCADACHAYQPGDTPCVPGSSHHGNVHVRLGGC